MTRITLTVVLVAGISIASNGYTDELYKCEDPEVPVRFATSEAGKEEPPKCDKWVEIRGVSVEVSVALEGAAFRAANEFLSVVAAIDEGQWGPSFPAVTTGELYSDPEGYGFETVSLEDADPGSFVVYRSLAGILVETRETEGGSWEKQVLYPSRAADFAPALSDLVIPGESDPIIIAPSQEESVAPALYRRQEAAAPGGVLAAGEGGEDWGAGEETAEGMEGQEEDWEAEAEASAPDP